MKKIASLLLIAFMCTVFVSNANAQEPFTLDLGDQVTEATTFTVYVNSNNRYIGCSPGLELIAGDGNYLTFGFTRFLLVEGNGEFYQEVWILDGSNKPVGYKITGRFKN